MADHLDSGRALERLGTAAAAAAASEKARSYDANNNAGARAPLAGQAAGANRDCQLLADVGEVEQAIGKQTRSASLAKRRTSELSESTSDDWHLLDADEERASLSSASCVSLASCAEREQPRQRTAKSHIGAEQRQQRDRRTFASDNKNKSSTMERAMSSPAPHNDKFIVIDNQAAREQLNGLLVHLCAGLYSLLPLASLAAFVALICLLFTKLWFLTIIYYSYLVLDAKTCNRGGRRWPWVYNSRFWAYLAAYFPIRLRHSRNFRLSPDENYILNYHPHGISAFGCVTTFATNGLNFTKLFPGVKSRFMVHETSFLVPVMRETFGLRGDCSVNSASFDYILSKRWKQLEAEQKLKRPGAADGGGGGGGGPSEEHAQDASGNLLALCGGGLAEADLSDMETLRVVCATRKGFVKKALIHGAHLVPCIAFGENSVFKKVNLKPGSLLHELETKWYQLFKFKHPIYYGASLFAAGSKLGRGVMPFKRPVTVCMADPIQVERVAEPSQRQIDDLHSFYIESLRKLYEDNEDLCEEYDRKLELL